MEQEDTKGCSGVSIDTPDPGQGLCTISFARVSQRPVSVSTVVGVDYNCCTLRVENQRKRLRAEDKGGAKKRGRPRKAEPTAEISAIQEEAAAPQEAFAVAVVPEPAEVIPNQTSGSLSPLLAVESQPASVLAGPASLPVFGSVQSPVFAPTLVSPPAPAPFPAKVLDTAPIPVQDLAPAPDAVPVPALCQPPVPVAPPAPPQVETLYIESQGREALDPVLIEDLGPDEEEDISLSQDKRADEGNKEDI